MSPFLALQSLTKQFGAVRAVDNVSLDIERGRFLTLLGPSGSGKTTLLMMIAGFVVPTSGNVVIDGEVITGKPPDKRNFGMVFQGYALFPHMTVAENVAFSLEVRGKPAADIRASVRRVLDMVQLTHLADRLPKQLSGGQQQRVAVARALAFDPDLLLLDEPLSALDKKLRLEVQTELKDLHQRLGVTFICVTHDQEEALSLSDEIAIMRDGRVEQVGSPHGLYEEPGSRFVADFLGRSNFLDGIVTKVTEGLFSYRCGEHTFVQSAPGAAAQPGQAVLLALRPEKIRMDATLPAGAVNTLKGAVVNASYVGASNHVVVGTSLGTDITVTVPAGKAEATFAVGTAVWLSWDAAASVRITGD